MLSRMTVTIKQIEELEYYQGPNAIAGIRFRTAGAQLGVSAWGMNVLEIEPHCTGYPEHAHDQDGQEEVYVVLRGEARLVTPAGEQRVAEGTMVHVPPQTVRKWVTDDRGVTWLALGATPGQAYRPRR